MTAKQDVHMIELCELGQCTVFYGRTALHKPVIRKMKAHNMRVHWYKRCRAPVHKGVGKRCQMSHLLPYSQHVGQGSFSLCQEEDGTKLNALQTPAVKWFQ